MSACQSPPGKREIARRWEEVQTVDSVVNDEVVFGLGRQINLKHAAQTLGEEVVFVCYSP